MSEQISSDFLCLERESEPIERLRYRTNLDHHSSRVHRCIYDCSVIVSRTFAWYQQLQLTSRDVSNTTQTEIYKNLYPIFFFCLCWFVREPTTSLVLNLVKLKSPGITTKSSLNEMKCRVEPSAAMFDFQFHARKKNSEIVFLLH